MSSFYRWGNRCLAYAKGSCIRLYRHSSLLSNILKLNAKCKGKTLLVVMSIWVYCTHCFASFYIHILLGWKVFQSRNCIAINFSYAHHTKFGTICVQWVLAKFMNTHSKILSLLSHHKIKDEKSGDNWLWDIRNKLSF